jgi:hypothetical protein
MWHVDRASPDSPRILADSAEAYRASGAFPWRSYARASPLQCLPHRLIVAAVTLGQSLARPAFAVQPDSLAESLVRHALSPEGHAGLAQVSGHGRPVQGPMCGERLHARAGLVLSNELIDLFYRQAALHLPLPHIPRSYPLAKQVVQPPSA